ncbi:MAG: TIGR00295 family protein [Methanohalobium sp.]|uniref:TIGR00295 family protein n=1 Tax=Methanohalobium sp. TaxID=2837493 RepID=UPI00397A3684
MISRTEALNLLTELGCETHVIEHCKAVSSFAVEIAKKVRASGKMVDMELVEIGGLLHDIGRSRTHGIKHAVEGAKIAESIGLDPKIIRIIKTHIGAGVTPEEAKNLSFPEDDYVPRTIEEKIIAHADNLVEGTKRRTLDEYVSKMRGKNLDEDIINRVKQLAYEIGVY